MRKALLASSAAALLWPAMACGQSAAPASAEPTAGEQDDASQPSRPVDRGDEIVVTAQRRSESLQNVPISVTALTSSQLESAGVNATQDLGQVTPGLNWGRSTSVSQPTIRGVGSRNASAGDEPNVATFIDGVYQPEQASTLTELSNIERIEVLKGPQGTLFGRNATGGAINIVTRDPDLNTVVGNLTATYGRFNYAKASGYLSVPISEGKAGLGIAAVGFRDDGYVRNVFLNLTQGKREGAAVRAKLLLQPTETIEIKLNGLYSYMYDESGTSGQPLNGNTIVRNYANSAALNPTGIPVSILIPQGRFTTATSKVPYFRLNQYMGDARVNFDLGFATLGFLGAYIHTDGFLSSSSDASPLAIAGADFVQTAKSWIEEVTLTSNGTGPFTWLVGVQGFQATSLYDPLTLTGRNATTGAGTLTQTRYGQKTRAIAGFAEATWEAVDGLFLTGGIRYTRDKKISIFQPVLPAGGLTSANATFTNTSPRAVVRYEISPRASVYASYTQGFKSGSYNAVTQSGALAAARPEKITAYEAGFKTNPTPGVTINGAIFHYRYTDLQSSVVTNNPNGPGIVTLLLNAPEAKITGLDLEGRFQLSDRFRATLGVSILDPKLTDFPNASVAVPRTTCVVAGVQPPCGNVTQGPVNVTGNDLIRAPRFTLNAGVNYRLPIGENSLVFDVNAFFSDKYFFDLTNRVKQPAYEVVNGSISFNTGDDRWKFSVFGQNLTNQYYVLSLLVSSNLDNAAYQKPRWFGVSAGYNF